MQTNELISRLNRALHLGSRSLESYLTKMSEPLLGEKGQREFASALEKINAAEAHQVEALEELIIDLGGVPDPGSFGMRTAYYNYLSPDYVIGLVKTELAKIVSELDAIAAEVAQEPAAQSAVKALAERNRQRLEILASIRLPERKAEMAVKPKITPPFGPAKKPGAPAPAPAAAPASAAAPAARPAPKPAT